MGGVGRGKSMIKTLYQRISKKNVGLGLGFLTVDKMNILRGFYKLNQSFIKCGVGPCS